MFNSSWGHTYINWSSSCQFEFSSSFWDNTYIDWSSSCQFELEFGTAPISISHFPVNLYSIRVGTTPISIGHSSYQFNFYGCTYIDRSSSYRLSLSLSFWVGITPISIGHLPCQFEFLGSYLYRSTIFLSVCVQFELEPYIYRSVIYLVNLSFWGRTYIDWLSSCQFQFKFSSWDHTYIDRSFRC